MPASAVLIQNGIELPNSPTDQISHFPASETTLKTRLDYSVTAKTKCK